MSERLFTAFNFKVTIYCLVISFTMFVFVVACKSKRHIEPVVTITPPNPVVTKDLTEEKAIDIAKNLLAQTKKTVSLQVHYWNTVMTKVACTQYDVDAGVRCDYPSPPAAPYGYKRVSQQIWTCCEQKDFPLYNSIGNWSADYSNQDDKWTVVYQFNADDLKYHFTWIIDDNSSQISEKGLNQ